MWPAAPVEAGNLATQARFDDGHLLAFGARTVERSGRVRIALVTEYYYPHLGGVTEHVHNLAHQFQRQGHPTLVVTSHMRPPPRGHDLPSDGADPTFVRRIGTSRTIYSAGSFARVTTGRGLRAALRELFRREQVDLVHVHGGLNPTFGLVAPDAAWDLGLPVVATFHSWFARSALCRMFRGPLQRRLDRHHAVIAVSEPVVRAHARYFEARWEIIPNGVDTEFFHAGASSGPPAGDPELLFLGRLDPRNGLDTLLAAMPRILERLPGARLTVAGDGPLRPVYERLARPLGSRVEFVGRVNGDRPEHYARAAMYLCPTTKASFGITLLEAMACGTPLVVSDITGFRELVGGSPEAVLVPVGNPTAWSSAILRLLDDHGGLAAMGAAGRRKAEAYAWPRIAARVMDVYRRVAAC
jgi:phosphatidyl-myo-inositol alpha-mannosyltransferase